MYVCEGAGWIKTNGQGGFCCPKMTYRHSISPRHCNHGLNTTDFMSLESTLLAIVGRDGEGSFLLGSKKSEFETCKISRSSVGLLKFGNCVQQVFSSRRGYFPFKSLQKKRHLLEHDKHLATALWLMGPKTEVSSVHFQHRLIYPHFSVLRPLEFGKSPPVPWKTVSARKMQEMSERNVWFQSERNTVDKMGEIQLSKKDGQWRMNEITYFLQLRKYRSRGDRNSKLKEMLFAN